MPNIVETRFSDVLIGQNVRVCDSLIMERLYHYFAQYPVGTSLLSASLRLGSYHL